MDRLSGVGYGLSEGDSIDIMISFLFLQIDEEFQTYMPNAAIFFLEDLIQQIEEVAEGEEQNQVETTQDIVIVAPYGRFEELATGDVVHVGPSELQRPVLVSMILQKRESNSSWRMGATRCGSWSNPNPNSCSRG